MDGCCVGFLAPLVLFVGLVIIIVGLFVLLSASIGRFTGRLSFYTQQLNGQLGDLQGLLDRLGLSGVDFAEVVNSSALVGAIGAVLSGIGGFLSSLFLILMIMLFLLSEGSAMMDRLRTSVARDNPQVGAFKVWPRSPQLLSLHLGEQLRQAHAQGLGYRVEVHDADVAMAPRSTPPM